MKSANKSNISDLFFMRTPLSEIKNTNNSYCDYFDEQQQQIQILEKKLLEQQNINQQQSEVINKLENDISAAKSSIEYTQNQLDQFYQQIKEKDEQLKHFEKIIQDQTIEKINQELKLMNKQVQTEETIQYFEKNDEIQEDNELNIDIAKKLFEKRIQQEYKTIKQKFDELDAREKGVIFRETKIKEFMNKIQQTI